MKKNIKLYGFGTMLIIFGGAGMATNIVWAFMVSVIMFSVGFGLVLRSYNWKE